MKRALLTALSLLWCAGFAFADQADVPAGSELDRPAPTTAKVAAEQWYNEDRIVEDYTPPMMIEPHTGPLTPRRVLPKDFYFNIIDISNQNRVELKFTEQAAVRWDNGEPYSKTGVDLSGLMSYLGEHPDWKLRRMTPNMSEEIFDFWEENGERNTGKDLANLNNWYVIEVPNNDAPRELLENLIKWDYVEIANYEPTMEEACTDVSPTTPEWTASQNHLEDAPLGVDADYAGAYHPSGRGNPGSWCIDVEWDWTENHEDFPSSFSVLSGGDQGLAADHGDACVGIVAACDNAYGMTGISYNVSPKGVSHPIQGGWVAGFNTAAGWLLTGESYWIEIHAQGPDPGFSCNTTCGNCGQFRYIAVEYWQSSFDAIETHTANGYIVYEAAGNGQMNLDHSVYSNLFQRWFRDSGAILCGAGVPSTVAAECWSNYGSRCDCSGWGSAIFTTGYGDLWNQAGQNQDYTDTFGGTSGATPMVVGAGNCLQGISQDKYGITLTPSEMRSYLAVTGTDWTGSRDIGERPDLEPAINWIEPDCVPWTRGGWSYSFVPRTTTGADGANCLISSNLHGGVNNTYLNVSGRNIGYSPAPEETGNVHTRLYRDGNYVWYWTFGGPIAPDAYFYWNNTGPITVRGGRHMTQWVIDPLNEFADYNENNDWIYRQFVWDPVQLADDVPTSYTRPPTKQQVSETYYNCDGYATNNVNGWWEIVAVCPTSTSADYDVRAYSEIASSTNGFDTYEASSAYISSIDFVGINENFDGLSGDHLRAGIVNWNDNNASYVVEADASTNTGTIPSGRVLEGNFSLTSTEIFDNWEFLMHSDGGPVTIEVEMLSGNADVVISLYGPDDGYFGRSSYNAIANSNGAGGSEILTFNCLPSEWYGVVVHKDGRDDYGETANFNLYMGTSQPDLVHDNHSGTWPHQVVVTQALEGQPVTVPPSLDGNVSTNRFHAAYANKGGAPNTSGIIKNHFLVDGPVAYETPGTWSSWPAGSTSPAWLNQGPVPIKGGVHTAGDIIDPYGVQAEWREDNNRWDEQFVWDPEPLTNEAVYTEPDEAPNFVDSDATQSFPTFNCDGYTFTGGYWSGASSCPMDVDDQYNGHLFDPGHTSTSGFDPSLMPSYGPTGSVNFCLQNGNIHNLGAEFYYGVTNNYQYPGTPGSDGYYVWQSNSRQDLIDPSYVSATLGNNQLIHVYDLSLSAGVSTRIVLDNLSANDLAFAVFGPSTAYGSRTHGGGTHANTTGDGGNETIDFVPVESGWHGLVIYKNDYSDLGSSAYNLIIGERDPMPVTELTIAWDAPGPVMHLYWEPVTQDVDGNPITVDFYELFYSIDPADATYNAGWTSAGSVAGSLTDALFYPTATWEYFVCVLIAVDSDGVALSSVPGVDPEEVQNIRNTIMSREAASESIFLTSETRE